MRIIFIFYQHIESSHFFYSAYFSFLYIIFYFYFLFCNTLLYIINILLFLMQLTQEDLKPFRQKLSLMKNNHLAGNLVNQVFTNMSSSITDGHLLISPNQIQLPIDKKLQKNEAEDQEKKLNQILQKKELLKKQLVTIDQEVQNLKLSKLNISRVAQPVNKHFKSELTSQDRQKLKYLVTQQKKFQKQLLQKTHQYEQRMKKIKQEQQQQKQRQKRQKFEQKKQQIQKTLQLIQKRRHERLSKIQQQKKALKQVLNKKKLHEEWQQKWKTIQQEQQKKKQQLKQEIRKMKKITHQQIKQHEKKYQQAMKSQKQSRLRSSIIPQEPNPFYKSIFLEQIQQQQKKQRQIQYEKKNNAKQFLNKIKQYNEKVKTNHKPIVKSKQKTKQQQKDNSLQNRSMSLSQTHQKGNEYMRLVNQKAAQTLKKKDLNVVTTNKEKAQLGRYKNYLKQLRKPQSQQQLSHKKSQISEIKQILKKQSLTQEQKFYKAKVLAEKLQNRQVIRSPSSLVSSINAKIQILRQVDF